MKIISWNVNGLRALHRSGHFGDVFEHTPGILCLQETKADEDQVPDEVRSVNGYKSYFSSSQIKKGYSGVATYTQLPPTNIEKGMGIKRFDEEGRLVVTHFDSFSLLNVYFPNGGQGPERIKYKLDFYDAFLEYIETLRHTGKGIIFCGDVNTAHEAIDLARPKENENNTGFLLEERAWIDEVVNLGYVDTFRHFNPTKEGAYSYWDLKSRARDRNVGWRIDYVFISPDLLPRLKNAFILSGIYGSDHCPVGIELL
jgi:exodeoxyribonuclease-3